MCRGSALKHSNTHTNSISHQFILIRNAVNSASLLVYNSYLSNIVCKLYIIYMYILVFELVFCFTQNTKNVLPLSLQKTTSAHSGRCSLGHWKIKNKKMGGAFLLQPWAVTNHIMNYTEVWFLYIYKHSTFMYPYFFSIEI